MFDNRSLWALAAAFGGFFVVLFIVFKVLDSEFFRGDPEQGGSARPIANAMTERAAARCMEKVAADLKLAPEPNRALPDYTAWDIGFNRYLVKGTLAAGAPLGHKTFICKIVREGDTESSSWTIQSLDYLN